MTASELTIGMHSEAGAFAQDKDKARQMRLERILPALKNGKTVILDFEKVDATTQSFVHALISDVIRQHGPDVLERLLFKNCNEVVRAVIEIVVDYMQKPPPVPPNGNGRH